MATTGATRRSTHTTTARRQTDRRGRHDATPLGERPAEGASATPAMHITPNVVIAARGDIRSRSARSPRRTVGSSALDLRRFRA